MGVFNRGLATGDSFCNREVETKQLQLNIQNHTHTVLVSPRRYGKTSLVLNTINKEKLLYAHIDLFMKYQKQAINQECYQAVAQLISKLIKPTKKAIQVIESILKNIKVALIWQDTGIEFSLLPYSEKSQSLKSLFEGLDQLLIKQNKNVIIFIDEVQSIIDSEMRNDFEADIRYIAQKTKNIIFIFSGSSRHLLSMMFDDKSRPFYKLCHQMYVKKIDAAHLQKHVQKYAEQKWHKKIDKNTLQTITDLTTCHSYYFNILCEKLFAESKIPTEDSVNIAWQTICREEQSSIGKDLEFLTSKQRQLLTEIAKVGFLKEPTSKEFVSQVNLTPKGVLDSLKILSKHDLIEIDPEIGISVIDPVLAYWATR